MPQTTQRRRRHYVADPRKSVQLTARDLHTLAIVKKYRFVTSRHILQLVDGSHQKLLKRMRDLMDAAYLLPIRHPAPRLQTGGSRPKVYGISNLGADALAAAGMVPRDHINWTRRNLEVSDPRKGLGIKVIPHTLCIADVMSEVESYAQKSGGAVRLIEEPEILATVVPENTRHRRYPFSWSVNVPYPRLVRDERGEAQVQVETRRAGVIPDRVFGLEFASRPEGRNRLFFFLEIDRGTMPVIRRADLFESTSIFRKLLGFAGTWVRGVHTERFGLKHFQVLIITTSPERVRTMVEAFKLLESRVVPVWSAHDFDRSRLSWIFRFADRASSTPGRLLKYDWVDGHGTPKPLSIPHEL